jgi:hypothetical protein
MQGRPGFSDRGNSMVKPWENRQGLTDVDYGDKRLC